MSNKIFIVYSITQNLKNKTIADFEIKGCYKIEIRAKTALQCAAEAIEKSGEKALWLNDHSLAIPNPNPQEETVLTYSSKNFITD